MQVSLILRNGDPEPDFVSFQSHSEPNSVVNFPPMPALAGRMVKPWSRVTRQTIISNSLAKFAIIVTAVAA